MLKLFVFENRYRLQKIDFFMIIIIARCSGQIIEQTVVNVWRRGR